LEAENVHKPLKTSQNILKIVSFIENANVNIHLNYTKNRNRFCRKPILRKNYRFSLIFVLFFPALLKTIEKFKF